MVIATRNYCAALGKWVSSDPWKPPSSRGHLKPWRKLFFCSFFLTYFFYPLRAATGLCFRIWPSNLCPNLMNSSSIQSKRRAIGMMVPMMERKWEYLYLSFRKLGTSQLRWPLSFWGLQMSRMPATVRRGLPPPARQPASRPARVSAASSEPVSWSSRFLIFKLWHSVKILDIILILGLLIPPPRLRV